MATKLRQVMFQNMEKPEPKKKPKRGRNAFQAPSEGIS